MVLVYPIFADAALGKIIQVLKRRFSNGNERVLGEKGLMAGNQNVGECQQTRKLIVLNDRFREILKKQIPKLVEKH